MSSHSVSSTFSSDSDLCSEGWLETSHYEYLLSCMPEPISPPHSAPSTSYGDQENWLQIWMIEMGWIEIIYEDEGACQTLRFAPEAISPPHSAPSTSYGDQEKWLEIWMIEMGWIEIIYDEDEGTYRVLCFTPEQGTDEIAVEEPEITLEGLPVEGTHTTSTTGDATEQENMSEQTSGEIVCEELQTTLGGLYLEHTDHASPETGGERASKKQAPISLKIFLFVGGVVNGYHDAGIASLLGVTPFLKPLNYRVFQQLKVAVVNKYCKLFNFKAQSLISATYGVQIVGILMGYVVCGNGGSRRTLLQVSIAIMLIGVSLSTWFPPRATAIVFGVGFMLRSCGLGLFQQAMNEIQPQIAPNTLAYDYGSSFGSLLVSAITASASFKMTKTWRVILGGGGVFLPLIFAASFFLPPLPIIPPRSNSQIQNPSFKRLLPPVSIFFITGTFSLTSAVGAIQAYGAQIYPSLGISSKEHYSPYLPSLVVSALLFLSTLFFSRLPKYCGRRPLLLTAGALKFICDVVIAVYFYLKSNKYKKNNFHEGLLSVALLYIVSHALLKSPGMWLKLKFPKSVKRQESTAGLVLGATQNAILALLLSPVSCHLNRSIFFLYMVLDLLILTFIFLMVPETTHLTVNTYEDMVTKVWSHHRVWGRLFRGRDSGGV